MWTRIGGIQMVCVHCEFLNVALDRLNNMMQSHKWCTCVILPQYAFVCVFLKLLSAWMQSDIHHICTLSILCYELSNAFSNHRVGKICCHIARICVISLFRAFFLCTLRWLMWPVEYSHWLHCLMFCSNLSLISGRLPLGNTKSNWRSWEEKKESDRK